MRRGQASLLQVSIVHKPVKDAKPVGAWLARDPRDARPFNDYAISRNSRRRILPTGVIGNDSRNTMCFGTLYAVKFSLQ